MSIYFEYGEESHDEYYCHGVAKARDEQQLNVFVHDQPYHCWWTIITEAEGVTLGAEVHDFEAEVHEAMIQRNIAAALRRKHLARDAYKAPTLADSWPTGV